LTGNGIQADIPARAYRPQKLQQSARPAPKFEAIQALDAEVATSVSADHVAHMQLGISLHRPCRARRSRLRRSSIQQDSRSPACLERHAHEYLRRLRCLVSIIELVTLMPAQNLAKSQKRSRRLRYLHRQQRLACPPISRARRRGAGGRVSCWPGVDPRRRVRPVQASRRRIFLDPGHRQRSRRGICATIRVCACLPMG